MANKAFDFSQDAEAIRRRRKIADMMTQKGAKPLDVNQSSGRFLTPISPFQGAAQLFNAYQGRKMSDEADAMGQDLDASRKKALSDAMTSYSGASQEDPEQMRQAMIDAYTGQQQPVMDIADMDREENLLKTKLKNKPKNQNSSVRPYYTSVNTDKGWQIMNARTGELVGAEEDGERLQNPQTDVERQTALSEGKGYGGVIGKESAKAEVDLVGAEITADKIDGEIDDLLAHPGMKMAVGASSILGIQHVPSSDALDFKVRLKQLKGGAFLRAYKMLRGGGQITEVEGQAATEAEARMDNAQSEEEFTRAMHDWQRHIRNGIEKLKKIKALGPGGGTPQQQPAPVASPTDKMADDEMLQFYLSQ